MHRRSTLHPTMTATRRAFYVGNIALAILGAAMLGISNAQDRSAQEESGQTEGPHPWFDDSNYLRVDKAVYPAIRPKSDSFDLVTDELADALQLSRSEGERINEAVRETVHEFRVLESRHLQLMPALAASAAERPDIPGNVGFALLPFVDEALALRRKIERGIVAILGEEKAKLFWQHDAVNLEGRVSILPQVPSRGALREQVIPEITVFARGLSQPASSRGRIEYRFQLVTTNSESPSRNDRRTPGVYLERSAGEGSNRIVQSARFAEGFDYYAPEAFKAILVRWRQGLPREIHYTKLPPDPRSLAEAFGLLEPEAAAAVWDDPPFGETRGHLGLDFVDIPKSLVYMLEFPGLAADGHLTPEAVRLFALSVEQQRSVEALFMEMGRRFEEVESKHSPHLPRSEVRSASEEGVAVQQEWVEKLQALLGKNRGEMLADAMRRSPASASNWLRQRD